MGFLKLLSFFQKYRGGPPIGVPVSYISLVLALFNLRGRESLCKYLAGEFPGYDIRLYQEGRQAFGFLLDGGHFKNMSIQSLTCPVMMFEATDRGITRVDSESGQLTVRTAIWGRLEEKVDHSGPVLLDACQIYPFLIQPEEDYILLSFNESKPSPGVGGGALLSKRNLIDEDVILSRCTLREVFRDFCFRIFQKLAYTPFLYSILKRVSGKKIGSTYDIMARTPQRPVLMSNFKAYLALNALKKSKKLKRQRDSTYQLLDSILKGCSKYMTSYELGYCDSHQYFLLPKKEYQEEIKKALDDCGISFFMPHRYDLDDLDEIRVRENDLDLRFSICLPMNFSRNEAVQLVRKVRGFHEKIQ